MKQSNFSRHIENFAAFNAAMGQGLLAKINHDFLETGKAFLAFRREEATIYYHGNQLCNLVETQNFDPTVYDRYLPLCRSKVLESKKAKNFSEREWLDDTKIAGKTFAEILPEICDNIEKDSSPESTQASRFYHFSPLNRAQNSPLILLDVEAAFTESDEKNRIDLVFYHINDQRLVFVEVKRLHDARWGNKNCLDTAKVIGQMKRYRDLLKANEGTITTQYNKAIEYYNALSGSQMLPIGDKNPILGLLLVEHSETEADLEKIENIRHALTKERFGVGNIGNTESILKDKEKDPEKPSRSLQKIYNKLKKYPLN